MCPACIATAAWIATGTSSAGVFFGLLIKKLPHRRPSKPGRSWVKVDKRYLFDGPHGRQTLAELFAGRSQLIVYHFMFGPGWVEGGRACAFLADHVDGTLVHLEHHDVSLHTYSAYARRGDLLLGTYNYLDLTPKGRNESGPMSWVRLHDTYDDSYAAATATVDEGR